jgi:hypothetical protein
MLIGVDAMSMDEPIRNHIEAIAAARDVPRLLVAVSGDRTHPVAREWVRRWRPARAAVAVAVCSCATGRCALCN